MHKNGWKELINKFAAITHLVHDKTQFQTKHKELRKLWELCNLLRYGSVLGRRPDGTVDATDDWWKEQTKVCFTNFSIM